ncbi:MAG: FHA domain-containing protein, partial [Planctomycetes bacterium]|nr:FHA domain-containing protein [Planctomycetota bacterium]
TANREQHQMPSVRVKNGPAKGESFEITDKPLSLGRDPTCEIQILDKGASRHHAEIFRIGEMCFIRDLESRNGSFVNDAKIEEELLREGDRIQIGATVMIFESMDKARDRDGGLEFSEEDVGNTLELRLQDLSAMNVGEGDGSEAARLRALYRLGRIIAEEAEERTLTDKVLPFAAEQIHADCAYLFTRDGQKGNIIPIGTWSNKERRGGKISRSIIRRAIQEKRALLTSDAMEDNRFSSRDSIVLKEIHSVICVPLSVSGDLSGVLYLASDSPSSVFSEEELELAAAMADQIGLAISHLRIQAEQRENLISTIRVLVRAVEMKDPTLRGRSERVASYTVAIGRQLKLKPKEIENLQLGALLHNIGLLAHGEDSLYRIGHEIDPNLSDGEKLLETTIEIVKDMACFSQIEDAIKFQLERNDGSGPKGIKGADIPMPARIIAVATAFDAIANAISQKPKSVLLKDAVVELGRQSGRKYDEDVVKALLIAHRNDTLHTPSAQQTEEQGEAEGK